MQAVTCSYLGCGSQELRPPVPPRDVLTCRRRSQWHEITLLAYNYHAMGFTDRDYQRGDYYDRQPGFNLGGARTLTTNLVIVMFAIYAIQLATRGPLDGQLHDSGWFTN